MNEYGVMAQQHWERHLPQRYRGLSNPEEFFTQLGAETAEQIDQLTNQLAGDDPQTETYLERLGRLNVARMQAREQILPEMVLLPNEEESPEETDVETPTGSEWVSEWIPIQEDTTHPWWKEQREL